MEKTKTANEIVKLARQADRVTSLEFIDMIFDSFVELHGDRYYGDDGAVVGGIAYLDSLPVTVIGVQKGRTLEENIATNFGSPSPEGYRKSLRLMKQAEKFNRPIITFVNTPGAFCGIEAEERGEGEAIANNLYEMSQLKVPVISIFTGEGGSGGAIGLAVANEVWMLEHSIYSILSPEGFASILWKDSSRAEEAAEIMKLTSYDLKELHVTEKIIPEMDGDTKISPEDLAMTIKDELIDKLAELSQLTSEELIEQRYERFRKF
ncbi:acetyl-CoA carboxylase carboxyltransferase subunit alpha [Vagococcus fluvialis]|uniref:acetyl-CoA carboxytransferase n=1 Tax=Vagococcus fluvialis TaxID=2738 RepID=A0A7X6DA86_9ENTE|nr:acetyl-CoA carboxylase carboxyltransferase subunit alpha [Vagococcus fluvialis]NKC68669.1 acetyl-CoA carboxylase carboxyltransferase subunit alpha [Vagococcus fluvialis]